MPRGGKRSGAGRPPKLPLQQRLLIGAECDRVWNEEYSDGLTRPYGVREMIIDQYVARTKYWYGVEVSPRAVASWWALFRKYMKSRDL